MEKSGTLFLSQCQSVHAVKLYMTNGYLPSTPQLCGGASVKTGAKISEAETMQASGASGWKVSDMSHGRKI